jgi:hypothetical protein
MVYLKVADKPDPHTRLEKLQFMIFTLEQTIKVPAHTTRVFTPQGHAH